MENQQNLPHPPKISEVVGSSDFHQEAQPKAVVIDLTDEEYEPAPKQRVLNSFQFNDRQHIPVPNLDDQQPGTSRQLLGARPMKRGNCTKCGASPDTKAIVHLDCQHRLCMTCFIVTLRSNRGPTNFCAIPNCNNVISDIIIKSSLSAGDYIFYLEHIRDNLRNALKATQNGNRPRQLEIIEEVVESPVLGINADEEEDIPIDAVTNEPPVFVEQTVALVPQVNGRAKPERRRSWLIQQQNLDDQPFWGNFENFECQICMTEVEVGAGIMLKNCLHSFCKECICDTVRHSSDAAVLCPGYVQGEAPCEFFIQDREIRALTPPDVYEQFLNRALKQGETNLDNVLHCKTPDCIGFVQAEEAATAFVCEVCDAINCIKCKAIHEHKTCEEYQFDFVNDVKNQNELKLTEQAVKDLVAKGEAMLCPKCGVLIQKDDGCDHVVCISCKLGICYRTKKPRKPLTKIVNRKKVFIDGCHCNENGKKCHPQCRNCH